MGAVVTVWVHALRSLSPRILRVASRACTRVLPRQHEVRRMFTTRHSLLSIMLTVGDVPHGWCGEASGHPSSHGGETSLVLDQSTRERLRGLPMPSRGTQPAWLYRRSRSGPAASARGSSRTGSY